MDATKEYHDVEVQTSIRKIKKQSINVDTNEDSSDIPASTTLPIPMNDIKNESIDPVSKMKPKPSKLNVVITESIAAIINTAKLAMTPNNEGCTTRGCQCFYCVTAALLMGGGIWTCWIWTQMILTHPETKYFIPNLAPAWYFISDVYALSVCWVVPIVCGSLLILATFCNRQKLSHFYYIITSWLLLLPVAFALYYIVFLGHLNSSDVSIFLKKRITDYDTTEDIRKWDDLQTNFKCCGVDKYGWNDWVAVKTLNGAVPSSCCKIDEKGTTNNGCPKQPSNVNTWPEGCLDKLLAVYYDFLMMSVIALCYVALLLCFSVFAATRYYAFFLRESNPQYRFTCMQYFQDCFCPLCCPRIVDNNSGLGNNEERHRSTENAFMHYVEHRGLPLTHKREFATQFSIVKSNDI